MKEDRDQFWKLLEPEYVRAMMFCRKLIGDRDSGDDLFQDALVTACTKFSDLRNPDSFRPWLYQVMITTFKSKVRRPWWKRRVPMTAEIETQLVTQDPTDSLTARRALKLAFRAVSSEDQALIVLHDLEGWSGKELADLFDKSESAIKVRMHRTRRKMKEALLKPTLSRNRRSQAKTESETEQCVAV
jgi:RNA polymerase sigma-70 factor (ECF subfamily)